MNQLDAYLDKLLAFAAPVLRETLVILRYMNRRYEDNPGTAGGKSIEVPIASAKTTRQIVPGPYAPATDPLIPKSVTIPLDFWEEASFTLTDEDVSHMNAGQLPRDLEEAVKALTKQIAIKVYGNYKWLYLQTGTPGTALFSDKTSKDASDMRVALTNESTPTSNRIAIANATTSGAMEQVENWVSVADSGTDITVREGQIGRKAAFDWFEDQDSVMPVHTVGNMGSGTTIKSGTAHSVGANSITVTGGTGGWTANEGDIFNIAGDPENYVVRNPGQTVIGGGSDGVININPSLRIALAGSEALTQVGADDTSYEIASLGFHRDCFAFASRKANDMNLERLLGDLGRQGGTPMTMLPGRADRTFVDDHTSIALRLKLVEQHYQTYFAFSIYCGTGVALPQLGVRAIGQ